MSGLTENQRAFLEEHLEALSSLHEAAEHARDFFVEVLSNEEFDLHVVDARAKNTDSLRFKILEKDYSNPAVEATDILGVRIITYFGEQVDRIAEALSSRLDVNPEKSVDKRAGLSESEFGYRSVHLLVKLRASDLRDSRFAKLENRWIEVQIRSVLDHSWAEIEHEIIYKSGILYSEEFRRRFFAVAGALEVLEQEFLRLRKERESIIEQHKEVYEQGREKSRDLDAARLIALLEVRFPEGKGWRKALRVGDPFRPHTDKVAVHALQAVGVRTASQLLKLFDQRRFQLGLSAYAASAGVPPAEAAHLPLIAVAVGLKDQSTLQDYFPELVQLPEVKAAISSKARKKSKGKS